MRSSMRLRPTQRRRRNPASQPFAWIRNRRTIAYVGAPYEELPHALNVAAQFLIRSSVVTFSAYIFAAREHYGLSVLSNGSNLPRLSNDDEWRPLRIKVTSLQERGDYTDDITTARFNLLSRGYHFCAECRVLRYNAMIRAQFGLAGDTDASIGPAASKGATTRADRWRRTAAERQRQPRSPVRLAQFPQPRCPLQSASG